MEEVLLYELYMTGTLVQHWYTGTLYNFSICILKDAEWSKTYVFHE